VTRVEGDLPVAEAQRDQAGLEVRLVAEAVGALLRGGAVESEAVGFHDDAELFEEEVDAVAVDLDLCLRLR
jgi:hypothetical protein